VIPPDVCPNIPGNQTTIPAGMIKNAAGNCVVPPPDSPTCALSLSATPIIVDSSTRLDWVSTSSNHIVIKAIVGGTETTIQDTAATTGSVVLTPATSTLYRATVTGLGGTAQCETSVVVTPKPITDVCPNIPGDQETIPSGMIKDSAGNCVTPPPDSPTCALTLSATPITVGSSTRLDWSSTHTNHILIKAIVGGTETTIQDTSAGTGSLVLTPATSTLYRATVTGTDGTAQCETSVVVTEEVVDLCPNIAGNQTTIPDGLVRDSAGNCVPPPLTCDSFTTSASPVNSGDHVMLSWNTTSATAVSIDNGIGAVSVDGSQDVTITEARTYTLTATRDASQVTCSVSIAVNSGGGGGGGGGGGSSRPECRVFRASDTTVAPGESVKLSWETRRGTRVEITPDILDTKTSSRVKEGSITVNPKKDTTYKLTVYKGSKKDTCTVVVKVKEKDLITAVSKRELAFNTLPYTGFDAGPFLTSVFYTLLALWSLAVAYVLVVKRGSVFGFSLPSGVQTHGEGHLMPQAAIAHAASVAHAPTHDAYHAIPTAFVPTEAVHHNEVPANLPVAPIAHASQQVASWKTVSETHEGATEESIENTLEEAAHKHNVLLSSDALRLVIDHGETETRSLELLEELISRAKASYPREDGWIVLNRERALTLFATVQHVTEAVAVEPVVAHVEGAYTLAEAIATGNTARAYELLGEDPLAAIADAAEALDGVIRARRGAGTAPDMLMHATSHVSDEKLKTAVIALVSAIDGTYGDQSSAVRLAVIKALKAVA